MSFVIECLMVGVVPVMNLYGWCRPRGYNCYCYFSSYFYWFLLLGAYFLLDIYPELQFGAKSLGSGVIGVIRGANAGRRLNRAASN